VGSEGARDGFKDHRQCYRCVSALPVEGVLSATRPGRDPIRVREAADRAARQGTTQGNRKDPGGKTVVSTKLTGNFPGSPLTLDFVFTLEGGKIAALEIKS
jgi:hypothetical protein